MKIDNFYDFGNRTKFNNEDNITKPYKVHNFEQLIILPGLIDEHLANLNDLQFKDDWLVLNEWKEDVRYLGAKQQQNVLIFINSVKHFSIWIKKYL